MFVINDHSADGWKKIPEKSIDQQNVSLWFQELKFASGTPGLSFVSQLKLKNKKSELKFFASLLTCKISNTEEHQFYGQ